MPLLKHTDILFTRPDTIILWSLSEELISVQVYKSASKRKAHILKNHPGAELPPSIRKLRPAAPGEPDPMLSTHTQLTGTIASAPVCCPHCAKQYSSKVSMQFYHLEYMYIKIALQ